MFFLVLSACSGAKQVETGITLTSANFTEVNARNVLGTAVHEGCSAIGISTGLASSLRIVERALATMEDDVWSFRFDREKANVTRTGVVSGELLKGLTSNC